MLKSGQSKMQAMKTIAELFKTFEYNRINDAVALLQKDIERACDAQNIPRLSQHLRRYTLLTPLLRNRQQMLSPQLLMDHMIITQHL